MTASSSTSVLASLTASVMEEKKAAAKVLTPVAGESKPAPRAPILPHAPAPFPNDIPEEVIKEKIRDLTRIIQHLTEARDALMAVVEAQPEAQRAEPGEAQRQRDQKSEENYQEYKARMERLAAEAQEQVFQKEPDPAPSGTWECPEHKVPGIEKTSSKGRAYIGCPDCTQFQR